MYLFFVIVLDEVFWGTIFFFVFQVSVGIVRYSCCVHCCSIYQIYWSSDRCGSEIALWCFFSEKNGRHSTDSFPFVWPSQLDIHKFYTNLKDSAAFLVLLLQFQLAYGTWKCLVFDFRFFGNMSSYVFIWDAFFLVTTFPF